MLDDRVTEVVPTEALHLGGVVCLGEVAKATHELQRREDRVSLQRASKHPKLDGVLVGDVHRVVAVALGETADRLRLLGPSAVRLRGVASRCPSGDLLALPAREEDDGLEQSVYCLDKLQLGELLRRAGLAEELAAYVDVEPAGRRVVAAHALRERRLADVAPHLLASIRHHVLGAHWMGDELAAVFEAPVVLEVEEVVSVHGADAGCRGIGVAVVHLKLHAEVEACRLRLGIVAEDRGWLEVVGLDGLPVVV